MDYSIQHRYEQHCCDFPHPAPRRPAIIRERLGYVGDSRLAAEETGSGRVVLLLTEIFREAAVLLSRRFRLPTYVRVWLLADLRLGRDLRPLYPRKQTLVALQSFGLKKRT